MRSLPEWCMDYTVGDLVDLIEKQDAELKRLGAMFARVDAELHRVHERAEELSQSDRAHDLGEACGLAGARVAVEAAMGPHDTSLADIIARAEAAVEEIATRAAKAGDPDENEGAAALWAAYGIMKTALRQQ